MWLVLPLILVASFLFYPVVVPQAHAAPTPTVCLRDPNSNAVSVGNPCSGSTPIFDGPAAGTGQTSPSQIRIGVYVNSSAALDGFDISLLANHTVLHPVGVDTTGTILPGSTGTVVECIGGKNFTDEPCATGDTADTIHFALESFDVLTTPPTTGLLFTAIYNITGTSVAAGISVGFATDCVGTSDNPVCVTITNGTSNPNPESVQTATFNNHTTPPWVAVSSNSTSLAFISGNSVGNHAAITATAEKGWPGSSLDLVSFSAETSSSSVTASFSSSSCSTTGKSCTVVVAVNGPFGNYSITALGEYLLTDPNFAGQTDTLLGPVSLALAIRDFSQTASPSSVSFNAGGVGTSTIQLTSLNHFAGTVSLSVSCSSSSQTPPSSVGGGGSHTIEMVPPSSCPPASLSPSSVTLSSGSSVSSTLTVSSPSYLGNYTYVVSGRTGSAPVHADTITTFVNDFNLTASVSSLTVPLPSSTIVTVTLLSLNKFAGTVTLSANVFPAGLLVSFKPASLSLTARGSATSAMNITVASGTTPGSYTVEIVATGGGISHTFQVSVVVDPALTNVLARILTGSGVWTLLAAGLFGAVAPSTWVIFNRRSRKAHFRRHIASG
jgi:hypothetical protein